MEIFELRLQFDLQAVWAHYRSYLNASTLTSCKWLLSPEGRTADTAKRLSWHVQWMFGVLCVGCDAFRYCAVILLCSRNSFMRKLLISLALNLKSFNCFFYAIAVSMWFTWKWSVGSEYFENYTKLTAHFLIAYLNLAKKICVYHLINLPNTILQKLYYCTRNIIEK